VIKFSLDLRAVALLRRIARALEESNRIARQRLEFEAPEVTRRRSTPKLREVFTPSIEEQNDAWRQDHPF
jgi:hypothetical protein